jgi:hypothetical protein
VRSFVRDRPLLVIALGVVLAGVVAGVGSAVFGIPAHYAVVAGLGVAAPAMNLGRGGSTFDRERYLRDRDDRTVALDVLFSGAMALLVGGVAVAAATLLGLRSGLALVAIAAAATALGGNSSFVYRTVDYRSIGPEES